ncbi:MAG: cupin domain-containing protein [Alphaproteobacteria bacterium]|nr:cupin domain-containing protein [Alphaproteobacteria bacterium]
MARTVKARTAKAGAKPSAKKPAARKAAPGKLSAAKSEAKPRIAKGKGASPYLFRAADTPLHSASTRLRLREAVTPFGIALRYQERAPGGPESDWCTTGHSVFVLAGRIRYQFDDHAVEAGPGDMLHIPAGEAHRHKPRVIGTETVRYYLTEFAD